MYINIASNTEHKSTLNTYNSTQVRNGEKRFYSKKCQNGQVPQSLRNEYPREQNRA